MLFRLHAVGFLGRPRGKLRPNQNSVKSRVSRRLERRSGWLIVTGRRKHRCGSSSASFLTEFRKSLKSSSALLSMSMNWQGAVVSTSQATSSPNLIQNSREDSSESKSGRGRNHRGAESSTEKDPLLTADDVAARLNVTKDWVWDHSSRKAPLLPVIRMGDGTLRYRASKIEDFINERERLTLLRRKRG
jgi:predicted DNA-binding transcriptional regulator AlpA